MTITIITITALFPLSFFHTVNAQSNSLLDVKAGDIRGQSIHCGQSEVIFLRFTINSDKRGPIAILVQADEHHQKSGNGVAILNSLGQGEYDVTISFAGKPFVPCGPDQEFRVVGVCGEEKELRRVGDPGNMDPDSECNVSAVSSDGCITLSNEGENFVGSNQNDCVDGKGGYDKIIRYRGNDRLLDGEGKDLVDEGIGNDELTGAPGPDTFQCGPGIDKLTDFSTAQKDNKGPDCEQF